MSVSVSLLRMGFIQPTVFLSACNGRYVHRLSSGLLKYIWYVCHCVCVCVCEPSIGGLHYMRLGQGIWSRKKKKFVNHVYPNIE